MFKGIENFKLYNEKLYNLTNPFLQKRGGGGESMYYSYMLFKFIRIKNL
jgi:hypothetical protein